MGSCRNAVLLATATLAMLALAVPAVAAPAVRESASAPAGIAAREPLLRATALAARSEASAARAADPTGPFALSGTVRDFAGAPVDGEILWGWYEPNAPVWYGSDVLYHEGGRGDVTDGSFSFPAVTSLPGSDSLFVYWYDRAAGSDLDLASWDDDFSLQQPFALRPGAVRIQLLHPPRLPRVDVTTGDPAAGTASTGTAGSSGTLVAAVRPPGFKAVCVQVESTRGTVPAAVGWTSAGASLVPVAAGETAQDTVTLDWATAVRGRLDGPVCRHSGPAGGRTTFFLEHWPAGTEVSFWGTTFASDSSPGHYYSEKVTSAGYAVGYRVPLTIPPDAPVGIYMIEAYRSDDPAALLDIHDYFLVDEFGASRDVIQRGEPVRLHGHVDGYRVTLFKRTTPAPRPAKLSAPGWTRVRSFDAGSGGRFRTGFTRPARTTWYVARYDGGDFPAFTQVVKVTVRND